MNNIINLKPVVNLVFATGYFNEIGFTDKNDFQLPWNNQKADMKRFVDLTTNNTVIMGFNTFLSFKKKYKPLKNRNVIVIDEFNSLKINELNDETFVSVKNIDEAFKVYNSKFDNTKLFVIGGAYLFTQIIENYCEHIDSIYYTQIRTNRDYYGKNFKHLIFCDELMTKIKSLFKPIYTQEYESDKDNTFQYTFYTFNKN